MPGNSAVKILVRVDADHHVGLGHAVRVAELLKHITVPLEVHVYGTGEQVRQYFRANTTRHILTDSGAENPAQLVEHARKIRADILLIDHPGQTRESWQVYADSPFPVIAIDDYGSEVMADLIFNGTILDAYHHYPLMADKTGIFCGGAYALLNPVFGEIAPQPSLEKSLIIVSGSGERARQWVFALTGNDSPFRYSGDREITMIVGASFTDMPELQRRCKKLDIKLLQNVNQAHLARMLSRHSMALITGGMIVYEVIASRCPVIIFPQEKNLVREVEWFAENTGAVNLGYDGGMDMKLVGMEIDKLGQGFELAALPQASVAGIDGRGIIRAAAITNGFLQKIITGRKKP